MAPQQIPAPKRSDSLVASSKSSSPLRTVMSPAAPEKGTGGMSPEGGLADGPGDKEKNVDAAVEDHAHPRTGEGDDLAVADLSDLLPEGANANAEPDDNDRAGTSDLSSASGDDSESDDSSASDDDDSSASEDDANDGVDHTEHEEDEREEEIKRGEGDDEDSDLEVVTPPPSTTAQPTSTTETGTLPTATRYRLRKRTAEQLEALRPVKRIRKSHTRDDVGEIDTIDNRRTTATGFEYRVTWIDGSDPLWLPRAQLIEDGNLNLIETLDAYYVRYPNREVSYQEYISRNARAYSALTDNVDNSCLPHAIQMALQLLGYQQESDRLPGIWAKYLEDAVKAKVPLNEGFHKTSEIVRYCRQGVPECGVEISIKTFRVNLFDGEGAGPLAIARRVLPNEKGVRVLKPGVYLVGAYKRNMRAHCFAMQVTKDEDIIVREEGVDSGIGDQTWLRMIKFIRKVEVKQNDLL